MSELTGNSPARSLIFAAARRLASFLLPLGIGVGEFVEISNAAFVAAAADQIRSRGGRVSTSQISVMTGLPRADVATIRSSGRKRSNRDRGQRTARVMHGWFSRPEYVDASGAPRPLRVDGRSSFRELVRRFAGDVTPNAVLRELIAAGMAQVSSDGEIVPLRRYIQAGDDDSLDFERLSRDIDVALTCCLPIPRSKATGTRRLSVTFERNIGPAVTRNVSIRIQRFLDALSEYLHAAARSPNSRTSAEPQSDVFHLIIAQALESESPKLESAD